MSATPKGTSSNTAFVFPKTDPLAQPNTVTGNRKVYFPPLPDAKKLKDKQKVKPLTKEFFIELIKLETDFQQKNFTVETIDELTQYYARAVEYYDSIKDNIASYFLFKIQDTLATKQSLKLLIQQNKIQKRGSVMPDGSEDPFFSTLPKKGTIEERSDESDEEKDTLKKRVPKKKESVSRLSYSQLKNEKAKFVNQYVNIDNKIEEEADTEKSNMNKMMANYEKNSSKFDHLIHDEIDDQKEKIRRKLEEKKAKKKNETILNSTSTSAMNMTFEKILDGLDDNIANKFNSDNKFNKSEFSTDFEPSPDNRQQPQSNIKGRSSNKFQFEDKIKEIPEEADLKSSGENLHPEIKDFDVSNENQEKSGEDKVEIDNNGELHRESNTQ